MISLAKMPMDVSFGDRSDSERFGLGMEMEMEMGSQQSVILGPLPEKNSLSVPWLDWIQLRSWVSCPTSIGAFEGSLKILCVQFVKSFGIFSELV